jgi:hypothetical protein
MWCFALVEGWRNYVDAPIHHIAFAQWRQCTKAIEVARESVASSNWLEIYFEDLLANPAETLSRICAGIGIENEASLGRKLSELLGEPVNALSAPGLNKWQRENKQEITELLPKIAAEALKTGYVIDINTGKFEVRR